VVKFNTSGAVQSHLQAAATMCDQALGVG